ncbi:MAG: hypothetical protein FJ224_04715, partial [Lentisphaerae bacterium]|nr:hypothetical protein [Lentisphaerota bacterium]
LSTRAAESVVRAAGHLSGIPKVITAMTLRHTHAVHCLENGWSIRTVQVALGHASVETTMLYQRCILPSGIQSPLARVHAVLNGLASTPAAVAPISSGPTQPCGHHDDIGDPRHPSPGATTINTILNMAMNALAFLPDAVDQVRYFYRTLATRFLQPKPVFRTSASIPRAPSSPRAGP